MKKTLSIVFGVILLMMMLNAAQIHLMVCGDNSSDKKIDIIDAFLIAQYSVGIEPSNFYKESADINEDNNINIQDALLIA